MYTSHYGPRQGIYQSMESFRTPHWRISQSSVLDKIYRYKANTRIMTPPNSFPARSLTKRTDYRPGSASSLVQLTIPRTTSTIPPGQADSSHQNKTLPRAPPPSRIPACTIPKPPPTRSKPKASSPPHTIPSRHLSRHTSPYFTSLTSVTAEIHPRPSLKSEIQQNSTAFPYPDPTKIKDNSAFAARLVSLARLECVTVQQEASSRWGSQSSLHLASNRPSSARSIRPSSARSINRPSSARSILSSTSLRQQSQNTKGTTAARKLPTRPKSARNLGRTKADISKEVLETKEACEKPVMSSSATCCASQSDLCSPLHAEEESAEEESTSDLGISVESLCVSEEAVQVEGVASGQHKQAWQPEEEGRGNRGSPKAKGKGKTLYKSSSSCSLGGHRTSPKRKGFVTKTRKK